MSEQLARSILKIIGIVTVLIGAIMTAQSLYAFVYVDEPKSVSALGTYISVEGVFGDVARAAIICNAVVMLMGFLLCALSPALARYVAWKTPSGIES